MEDSDLALWLMASIQDASSKVRVLEDVAKKHSIDLKADRAYIACVAYRDALNDVLLKIRSADDRKRKGGR